MNYENEINALATSKDRIRAFKCFGQTLIAVLEKCAKTNDKQQWRTIWETYHQATLRTLLNFGVAEEDIETSSRLFGRLLKEWLAPLEKKRLQKRDRQRKRRANRTPEQAERERTLARERMRKRRANRTPEQAARERAYRKAWEGRDRERLKHYRKRYAAAHPKRKRGGLTQGDLFA